MDKIKNITKLSFSLGIAIILMLGLINPTGVTATANTHASIDVDDQAVPDNNQFTIKTVTIAWNESVIEDAFVIIHKDNGGSPGDVIGVKALINNNFENKTIFTNVIVDINSLDITELVYAMLHDNPDKGTDFADFDANVDTPARDHDGNIIVTSFKVSNYADNGDGAGIGSTDDDAPGFFLLPTMFGLFSVMVIIRLTNKISN